MCTTCGKLLRAENPRKQPGTEEEFVEVAEKLIDMGNYDEAYTLSGEGLKKYFSSSSLKKMEALAKQKIEDVRIDGLNKKAEEAASAGRFKEAVNAWEKAGEWSPEIRNGNKKKISQARAALRKKRLVKLAAVLGTLAAAAVILAVLCRKNVYPCLSRICKKAGLRIAFLERYESKGIEEAHPDRHSSAEDLLALLEKGQGKALSEHEKRVLKRARGLLADICRNMIENRVPDKSFFKLLTTCQEYAGRTHDKELFRDIREQAVAQCLEQCRKEGLLGKDECLAALKNLRPHADGTGREQEIDSLIEIYESELSREKKHESPEAKAAWAAFNRIIRIENTGDYNKAASEYRKLLSAKSMDTIPEMKERVKSRLHSIKTYQREANELLEKANTQFQTDRKKAASLYAKIKNEYPNSNAVIKVRLPLNIIADPGDADIYVNGKKQDPGSSVIYCSPFSTHILEVRKKGYVPQKAVISEIPYSLSSTWKAEFSLCEAPDQTIHSKEHLRGAGNFGDMIYSAGRNAAVAFYPFKKQTKPEYFAYPEQVADTACASLIWAEVQQGQNPCMLRNSTLVRFDPITEKTSLAGRIEHTPVSPIHLSYFYPGKDEGLCYWDKEGVLRCVALKDISEMWKKKYKDGYAGTGLASYKKHIITTHPDKEQIVFMIKKSGDIEKTFPARGKTHFFTVAHSQVFVCTGNGTIIRINAARDIKEEWRSDIGLPVSVPVIAGKTHFYACTEEGTCIAGNTRNGKPRWRVKLSDHSLKGGVFLKNKVYIYDSYGIIYAVSPGGTIEKRLYGIDDIASELILFNGKLLFMSKKGSCVVYTL